MPYQWLVVFITIIFSAFFSGLEIAFLTANKLRIELLHKRKVFPSQILSFFIRHASSYLSTMLVGNCIALVVFSISMAEILKPVLQAYITSNGLIIFLQTILSTILILVTGEFLPKNIFRINPNRTLAIFAVPLFIIYWILSPIVYITNGIAKLFLHFATGTEFRESKLTFGRIDLDHFVREGTSPAARRQGLENEVRLFERALGFPKVKARDCMVPRTEIVAIDVDESIANLKKLFEETRLSKVLIYRTSMDNIIGYTHSSEIFKKPDNITSILLPVLIIPESIPASEVLTLFIQQHKSVALVVDEFGGTAGMLTTEDIIEEIFGEIEDEHDKEEMVEKKINENEFIFSGRLEIDYLNETYRLNLPASDEYTTLAGFILYLKQSIPKPGEVLTLNPYVFRILSTTDTAIDQIHIKIIK